MKKFYSEVYDLLIEYGAPEDEKASFIHSIKNTSEWRFKGIFGFGGKYRTETNKVDYYSENHTAKLDIKLNELNEKLSKLK